MEKIWETIIMWLEQHAPGVINDLLPGASAAELSAAEKKMDAQFPEDMKRSLSAYNGQRGAEAFLMGEWQLIPLKIMVRTWKELSKVFYDKQGKEKEDEPLEAYNWNNKLIPVAYNGAGDYMCINLGKKTGTFGEIIIYGHMEGVEKKALAGSYKDWLKQFADDLTAGKYKYEDGLIIRTDRRDKK